MAHIVSEKLNISFSQIVKDDGSAAESAITADLITTLETVAQELVGKGIVVEVNIEK